MYVCMYLYTHMYILSMYACKYLCAYRMYVNAHLYTYIHNIGGDRVNSHIHLITREGKHETELKSNRSDRIGFGLLRQFVFNPSDVTFYEKRIVGWCKAADLCGCIEKLMGISFKVQI